MGAWIEIFDSVKKIIDFLSHPTWVRGLKLGGTNGSSLERRVAPHMGAWIEIMFATYSSNIAQSHPTWVRGLKLERQLSWLTSLKSHPTWVRGLKLKCNHECCRVSLSRTPHGCVD